MTVEDKAEACPECDGRGVIVDAPGNVLDGRVGIGMCPICHGLGKPNLRPRPMSRRNFGSDNNPNTARQAVEDATILRVVVGSTVFGLNVKDGLEDSDEIGICVEPLEAAINTGAPFEQFIYRTAAIREKKHDAPSQAGDLDLCIYSLRKYCRLALDGNPTVLVALFSEPVVVTRTGEELRGLWQDFASRQAGKRFLGYLQSQRQRMLGERGNGGHGAPRSALTAQFGYDTKFAMHMLRLGYQGIEYLETGSLTLPMCEPERQYLRDVRNGQYSQQDVLTKAGELEVQLKDLLETSPLPDQPNRLGVEEWMTDVYRIAWTNS